MESVVYLLKGAFILLGGIAVLLGIYIVVTLQDCKKYIQRLN